MPVLIEIKPILKAFPELQDIIIERFLTNTNLLSRLLKLQPQLPIGIQLPPLPNLINNKANGPLIHPLPILLALLLLTILLLFLALMTRILQPLLNGILIDSFLRQPVKVGLRYVAVDDLLHGELEELLFAVLLVADGVVAVYGVGPEAEGEVLVGEFVRDFVA